ncbi:hypothetical protein ABT299_15790 [Spirillospora sp. NPDC000708]
MVTPTWGYTLHGIALIFVLVLGVLFGSAISELRGSSTGQAVRSTMLVFIALVWLAAALTAPASRRLDHKLSRLDLRKPGRRRKWQLLLLFSALCSTYTIATPDQKEGDPTSGDWSVLAIEIFIATIFTFVWQAASADLFYLSWRRKNPGPSQLDLIMMRILDITYWVEWCTHDNRWSNRSFCVILTGELERIARESERFALRRVPWWDLQARREARRLGLRLAAIIRMHKVPLATAVGMGDFIRVEASLLGGLIAWQNEDLEELLKAVPEVGLRAWIRPLLGRAWSGLILALMALWLPNTSAFHNSPQAADSVRAALLISAILALISGGVAAPERVNAVLDKALPFGPKKE